jgi:hypothetical protein
VNNCKLLNMCSKYAGDKEIIRNDIKNKIILWQKYISINIEWLKKILRNRDVIIVQSLTQNHCTDRNVRITPQTKTTLLLSSSWQNCQNYPSSLHAIFRPRQNSSTVCFRDLAKLNLPMVVQF